MNYFNKNRKIFWIVIAVIIINFAAIGTIIYKMYHMENCDKGKNEQPCAQSFLEKKLQLSLSQAKEFKKLKDLHHDTVYNIQQEMKEKRELITENMVLSETDTTLLYKTADELGVLFSLTRKLYIQHYFDLRKLCTPDQQKKLDSIYTHIFCGDENLQGPSWRKCQRGHNRSGGCDSKNF